MSSLKQLTKKVIEFREARNWDRYHGPKDLALGMLIEASEFAELVQYFSGEELQQKVRENKQALADELADVFWWVLLAAEDLDIDLEAAFITKMKKNGRKYPAGSSEQVGKPFAKKKTGR